MSFIPLIGVAGQAQNGKDTLSDLLQASLNSRTHIWHRSAFARAVKQIFMDAFGKDAAYIEQWKVIPEAPPDLDKPVRQALQFIGDGFRGIKSSIWIDILMRDTTTPRIVSDLRYVNELRAVNKHGGFNILVVHPDRINDDPNGSEAQMRPFADFAMKHYSQFGERAELAQKMAADLVNDLPPEGWAYLDMVVVNSGTIQDLSDVVDHRLHPILTNFFGDRVS